jgi:hypothetical protein
MAKMPVNLPSPEIRALAKENLPGPPTFFLLIPRLDSGTFFPVPHHHHESQPPPLPQQQQHRRQQQHMRHSLSYLRRPNQSRKKQQQRLFCMNLQNGPDRRNHLLDGWVKYSNDLPSQAVP